MENTHTHTFTFTQECKNIFWGDKYICFWWWYHRCMCISTHQDVYVQHVQYFVCQLYNSKVIFQNSLIRRKKTKSMVQFLLHSLLKGPFFVCCVFPALARFPHIPSPESINSNKSLGSHFSLSSVSRNLQLNNSMPGDFKKSWVIQVSISPHFLSFSTKKIPLLLIPWENLSAYMHMCIYTHIYLSEKYQKTKFKILEKSQLFFQHTS